MSAGGSVSPLRHTVAKLRYFNRNAPPEVLDKNGAYKGVQGLFAKVLDAPTKPRKSQLGEVEFKDTSREQYERATTKVTEELEVPVVDARTAEEGGLAFWDLNTHGFMILKTPPHPPDFTDTKVVKQDYYPQLAERAKAATGATRCCVLYHGLRRENPEDATQGYAGFCHGDGGPDAVQTWRQALLKRGFREEEVMNCEIMHCNVWHPRERPAFRDPLCILDASSMRQGWQEDETPLDSVKYKSFTPQGFYALGPLYSPSNRWVFVSDMAPEEAFLFKNYDTRAGVAKCGFHNSFHDPFHDKDPSKPGRRSCEFSLLFTFPKQEGKENNKSAPQPPPPTSRL